eukprot:2996421-Rhodomonas_salina.1
MRRGTLPIARQRAGLWAGGRGHIRRILHVEIPVFSRNATAFGFRVRIFRTEVGDLVSGGGRAHYVCLKENKKNKKGKDPGLNKMVLYNPTNAQCSRPETR